MKLGLMIGTPDLLQPWVVVLDGADLDGNLRQAAEWGYDGVELALRDPACLDANSIKAGLTKYGLEMIGLCTGEVFGSDGLGLVSESPDIAAQALARMKAIVDLAAQFGAGTLVNIGRVRGAIKRGHPRASWERAVEMFRELSKHARPGDVRLVLEPINHYEVNFVLSTQDGIDMAEQVDHPNFGLILDTYHMNIEDPNIHAAFRRARRWCWHVHVSDNNRRWPGNAHIDFASIVATLRDIGYDAYLSAEILAQPDRETAGVETIRHMRRCLEL